MGTKKHQRRRTFSFRIGKRILCQNPFKTFVTLIPRDFIKPFQTQINIGFNLIKVDFIQAYRIFGPSRTDRNEISLHKEVFLPTGIQVEIGNVSLAVAWNIQRIQDPKTLLTLHQQL
ncbi:hypothetical protein [Algoriphagus boritolerans]|uniref:hypothetical protein n=1 Tax=Algoriphagus boritolerans TaxID=308111 RepID=UPI002FCE606E